MPNTGMEKTAIIATIAIKVLFCFINTSTENISSNHIVTDFILTI
jgi:hypothetical protein